jgi:hypothetical protein
VADESRLPRAGPIAAWISGVVAGAFLASLGVLAAPHPANELVMRQLAIEPVCVMIAGALAAAVPAYRLRMPIGQVLALGLGGALLTFLSVWVVHWISVGGINGGQIEWRRDLAASFVGVTVASTVSTVMGDVLAR